MPELREISDKDWMRATEFVQGQDTFYHVPNMVILREVISTIARRLHLARTTGRVARMIPVWEKDLDQLFARFVYFSMLPPDDMPIDGVVRDGSPPEVPGV